MRGEVCLNLFSKGCTGAMAHEFTKAHPGLSVTVFDLPAVVEISDSFLPPQRDSRVSFVAGRSVRLYDNILTI